MWACGRPSAGECPQRHRQTHRARASVEKHVTAHTLRHTSATWLRQATGDTRLVAEYLGHADVGTVSRYAHVAAPELHAAVQTLGDDLYAMLEGQDAPEQPSAQAA